MHHLPHRPQHNAKRQIPVPTLAHLLRAAARVADAREAEPDEEDCEADSVGVSILERNGAMGGKFEHVTVEGRVSVFDHLVVGIGSEGFGGGEAVSRQSRGEVGGP